MSILQSQPKETIPHTSMQTETTIKKTDSKPDIKTDNKTRKAHAYKTQLGEWIKMPGGGGKSRNESVF